MHKLEDVGVYTDVLRYKIRDLFTDMLGEAVDESNEPTEVVSILQRKINEL